MPVSQFLGWFTLGVAFIATVGITYWLRIKTKRETPSQEYPIRILGTGSPVASWIYRQFLAGLAQIKNFISRLLSQIRQFPNAIRVSLKRDLRQDGLTFLESTVKNGVKGMNSFRKLENWLVGAELVCIVLWALWVGSAYLDFDPLMWPTGLEYPSGLRANFIWTFLPECGTCIFWDGSISGGNPAFAELLSGVLHPLVSLPTLILGVVNGSKVTLLASLMMAGFAQWWLVKVMGLGRVARLWAAGIAVAGGQLAGKMEPGQVTMVLSTAACSLVIAPLVGLGLTGRRRYAVWLGITLALAFVAGQGYMQIGLMVGIFPAVLIFLFNKQGKIGPVWKEYLIAGGLSILLAGIFLVPLLHFLPNIAKDSDASFPTAQSIEYLPLNLVIDSVDFFNSDALKPSRFPVLYVNYVGWVPVLLAMLSLRFIPKNKIRLLAFYVASLGLVFLAASAISLKALSNLTEFFAGVRHASVIAGLAVPLVLALAAWGLDGLLHLNWPKLVLINSGTENSRPVFAINTTILVLTVPLLFSLSSASKFSQNWYKVAKTEVPRSEMVIDAMVTESSQWVDAPFGEHFWPLPLYNARMKLGVGISPWSWKGRARPDLRYMAYRGPVDDPSLSVTPIGDINVISRPENQYAYLETPDGKIPCQGFSKSGIIDVICPTAAAGNLVVQENNWDGWYAWMDLTAVPLAHLQWLQVKAPAGTHTYQFRYLPWDVWVGLGMTIAGILACIYFWRNK